MIAVAFTDLHLGISTVFNDRIFDTLNKFAIDVYENIKPDVVICLGDVFHTKKPLANVIEFATKWFSFWSAAVQHVLIIPGNHDQDSFSNMTAVDFLDDLGTNIQVIYEPTEFMDMLFVPYQRVLSPRVRESIKIHKQVFLHQGYSNAPIYGKSKYGERTDAVTPKELENKDLALIGHIHAPYYEPKNNIYVLGAPYQLRYVDTMVERGYGCWTVEDPSDFQLMKYPTNFYLEKVRINIKAKDAKAEDLAKILPVPAKGHYYQVDLSVEGNLKPIVQEELRRAVNTIYNSKLDSVTITSVLPQTERTFYHALKVAGSLKAGKAPSEMLAAYMDGTKGNFYKANPTLRQDVLDEFSDIVQVIAETDK